MDVPIVVQVDYALDDLRELNVAHQKQERPRQWWLFVTLAAVIVAAAVYVPVFRRAVSGPTPVAAAAAARPSLLTDLVVTLGPYVLTLFVIIVILRLHVRSVYRRAFGGKNPLQRRHTIELSPRRLVDAEPLARHEYEWDAFVKWVETPNLLLLYLSRNMMIPLPKRAFASPEQVERCRGLLRAMIDTPRSARQAFPIIPAETATAVLPIPPLHTAAPPVAAPPSRRDSR